MPNWQDTDTGVGWSFGLEFDGRQTKQIQEVTGLKAEQDVIEMKHNTMDGKYVNKKLPGRPKSGEITVTRGLTDDKTWQEWHKESQEGNIGSARKGGAVIVYDYQGAPVQRYVVTNGWIKSLEIGTLKAGDTSVLTEKMTITHEGLIPE